MIDTTTHGDDYVLLWFGFWLVLALATCVVFCMLVHAAAWSYVYVAINYYKKVKLSLYDTIIDGDIISFLLENIDPY